MFIKLLNSSNLYSLKQFKTRIKIHRETYLFILTVYIVSRHFLNVYALIENRKEGIRCPIHHCINVFRLRKFYGNRKTVIYIKCSCLKKTLMAHKFDEEGDVFSGQGGGERLGSPAVKF